MFLAHSFRLRDPWQCESTGAAVRWSRGFHRPTGLEPDDALWLVISGLPADAVVSLNGTALVPLKKGTGSRLAFDARSESPADERACPLFQWDVTHLVADSNQLEIMIPSSLSPVPGPLSPPFPYDVRLGVMAVS